MKFYYFLVIFSVVNLIESAKIIGIFPYPMKSHSTLGQSLMNELAIRDHDVTFVSMYKFDSKLKNYHSIELKSSGIRETIENAMDVAFDGINGITQLTDWFDSCAQMQEFVLSDKSIQNLLESQEKFDLCIIEILCNESLLGFSYQLGCKVIVISTVGQIKYINNMLHSPMPLSHIPHPFSDLPDRMNFWQRMKNVVWTLIEDFLIEVYHLPRQEAIYDKYFTLKKPKFRDAIKNSVSLALLNTHFTLNFPQAYLPNMVSATSL